MFENKKENRTRLEERMRRMKRGDEIPVQELEAILQTPCMADGGHSTTEGYSIARRASKFMESETNGHLYIRWDRERNAWRALMEDEIPDASTKNLKQIRRKSKSNARICHAAITDGLQGKLRDRALVNMALSNAIYTFCSRSVADRTVRMANQVGVGAISEEQAMSLLNSRTQS